MDFKVVSPILGFDAIREITFSPVDDFFSKLAYGDITFTLIDPSRLREYVFEIPLFYKKLLEIEEGDDVRVYCTVIVDSVIENSRINFAAPMILNHTKKLLVQVALEGEDFGMAEPISEYL